MGWPNNYVQGVYDSSGKVVGIDDGAGGDIYISEPQQSALSLSFQKLVGQSQPVTGFEQIASIPAELTGTPYYIDNLHASKNDAGAGTSPTAPWAEFKNINGKTFGNGDTIYVANDNVFNYEQTLANYNASPHFTYLGAENFGSDDKANPLKIIPFYPRGYSSQKPKIRWYANVVSGDWTNETGIHANVWSIPLLSISHVSACLAVGDSETLLRYNTTAYAASNAAILQSLPASGAFTTYGNKLYIYSVGNPNSTYGLIKVYGRSLLNTYYRGLRNTIVSGLHINLTHLAYVYSEAPNAYTNARNINLEVVGNIFTKANTLQAINNSSMTVPLSIGISVHDNEYEDCPGPANKLNTTGNNTVSYEVYRNRMIGGNLTFTWGAILGDQARGGKKHIAWGNYGFNIQADPTNNTDGSFIYIELTSNTNVTYGNIVEKSVKLANLNCSKNCSLLSNLAIDCVQHTIVTNDGAALMGAEFTLAHNTYLWTGRYAHSDLPANAQGANAPAFIQWATGTPTNYDKFIFINNLAISLEPVSKRLLTYNSSDIVSSIIKGNGAFGFLGESSDGRLVVDLNGNVDRTSTAVTVKGSADDALALFPYARSGNLVIDPDVYNPLQNAGIQTTIKYVDITGKPYNLVPSVGCMEFAKTSQDTAWLDAAVNNAILLNTEKLLYASNTSVAVTGGVTEVFTHAFTLPALAMGKNGYFELILDLKAGASNANSKELKISIGGAVCSIINFANQLGGRIIFRLNSAGSLTAQYRSSSFAAGFGYTDYTTTTLNHATDLAVQISVTLANAGDTLSVYGVSAKTQYVA